VSAPAKAAGQEARAGALAACGAYLLWGLVPLYWTRLQGIPALELIAHRFVWSLVVLLALTAKLGELGTVWLACRTGRALGPHLLSAGLLTGNWLIYVWGVNAGHVIETSLGYFLVPLVNVAAGRFLLHEQLRRTQWVAIASAAMGVGLMIAQAGRPPWIALALAATWGGYGLMRKRSPLAALPALTVETLLLLPLAAGALVWYHLAGQGALGRVDGPTHALLLSAGVITTIPLLLFGFGARRIRLTTLGLLQYLAPSLQLALGVWVYREPFTRERALSFTFIWTALALYTVDNVLAARRARA
jgi:chloramphenicol-sensitive protein RarD